MFAHIHVSKISQSLSVHEGPARVLYPLASRIQLRSDLSYTSYSTIWCHCILLSLVYPFFILKVVVPLPELEKTMKQVFCRCILSVIVFSNFVNAATMLLVEAKGSKQAGVDACLLTPFSFQKQHCGSIDEVRERLLTYSLLLLGAAFWLH